MVKQRDFEFINKRVVVVYEKLFPIYLVLGENNFMIDCGVAARAKSIDEKIAAVFARVPADHRKGIDSILLTHSHYDHVGGCTYFQDKYDCPVAASTWAVKLLQKQKVVGFIRQLNEAYERLHRVESAPTFGPLKNLTPLLRGDLINMGNESYLEVVETPGHTRCSISFFLLPERVLFPGDTVGVMGPDGKIKPLFLSSYTEYVESLVALESLNAEVLALCHNKYLEGRDNVRRHLRAARDSAATFKDRILEKLAGERDFEKIAAGFMDDLADLPSGIMGPREAGLINLTAMVKVIAKEFTT